MRRALVLCAGLAACGGGAPPAPETAAPSTPTSPPAADPVLTPDAPAPTAPPMPDNVRYIVYGGVDGPSANELSIEDELIAVTRRLGPEGAIVLYGGGPGSHTLVADESPRGDPLLHTLGELLDPRAGRDGHYQPLRLVPHGQATQLSLQDALDRAQQSTIIPGQLINPVRTLLWIAGHGGPGESPSEVTLADWYDGVPFTPRDLLAYNFGLRPLRIVQTTCYGGGFAEAVLGQATLVCGLFATTWDLPASGCDPDPTRKRDSYGMLLLGALAVAANDLDQDGRVGLAEAHVAATIAAPGLEVPILSSQHWLAREITTAPAPAALADEPLLTEERALVAGLAARTGVAADDIPAKFDELAAEEHAARARVDDLTTTVEVARDFVRTRLLARWPMLDDPWHPDFAATYPGARAAIEEALEDEWFQKWRAGQAELDAAQAVLDGYQIQIAPFDRALVALATIERAAVAKAGAEGSTWATFETLRRCEREPLP